MDMRALLEKMYKFAGGSDQKQGPAGQLRGGTVVPKKGSKNHPAHHKLVGGDESYTPQGNMLEELAKESHEKNLEWKLEEAYKEFLEAEFKDTHDRRPARKGSREEKYGRRGHKEQPRYNYYKEKDKKLDEAGLRPVVKPYKGWSYNYDIEYEPDNRKIFHDAIKGKERITMPWSPYAYPTQDDFNLWIDLGMPQVNIHDREDLEKIAQSQGLKTLHGKDQVEEYGANPPQGTAGQTATNDPNQAKNTQQATQALKAATGSAAPGPNIAKALDAASKGTGVSATDMKVLEPIMKDMATVAQNPQLANQFKNLANQINQAQRQQPK